ncbi:uncharacterized protein GGS22DRAFT_162213 [Annulohypoxylon maeteangense]|uniref:uncharacterized protein n=1 Tax=Annulohypoxylon maeteangense TaxID=1927788 RepID=UPI00200755CD|nr:uncharacterized protein GGS22DRAFT_162213 [Annulohypoxylon maeteangense]KAI0885883.1 hypothetical protein GGS22DRAFT_162213 [Annulohypoxylon maeteangense]
MTNSKFYSWNCIIFSAIPVTKYQVALVTSDFLHDPQPWNNTWITDGLFWSTYDEPIGRADHTAELRGMLLENQLERLDRQACVERYIDTDIRHKDVVIVASNISMDQGLSLVPSNKNSSLIYMHGTFTTRSKWMWTSAWMCSSWHSGNITVGMGQPWCSSNLLLPHADDWLLKSWRQDNNGAVLREVLLSVDYCLSAGAEQIPQGCAIRYSSILILIVTLIIVGGLIIVLVKALTALVGYEQSVDFKSLWQMGLGHVQAYAISLTETWGNMGENAFYATAFLANGCQIILSSGWYFANSLLSRMLLARQWSQFITQRKNLRVSEPTGDQRSSYTLSLPYRYSIPLLIASAMAHWLMSQSLFVVQTLGFMYQPTHKTDDGFVRIPDLDGSVLGFSAIGMILTIITLGILLIALLALSMRKLPCRKTDDAEVSEVIRMPVSAACSAAISSACHPSAGEKEAELLPLQWGKDETGVWGFTSRTPLGYSLRG